LSEPAPQYEPVGVDEEWLDDPVELPPRPRRRLLAPLPLALLAVLLIACGFIAGVLVEKGESPSAPAAGNPSSFASRFAALRAGVGGLGGGPGGAGSGAGAGATVGQVAYLSGSTMYVTMAEGNTVKVLTSPTTSVTRTVKSDVKGVHPGETVVVRGASAQNGAVSAESIRIGGGEGGGLAELFGGSGAARGSGAGEGGRGAGGGGPALFGSGG
jgi:hypothetical protein